MVELENGEINVESLPCHDETTSINPANLAFLHPIARDFCAKGTTAQQPQNSLLLSIRVTRPQFRE